MYPEISSHTRKAKEILDEHHFIDSRVERVLECLLKSVEFLSQKVWEQDQNKPKTRIHPAVDPHRYLPGSDD
ncbi:MAG TPA: hypothetical protein VHA06_17950 [Candidatus Angelobacter sp.]|jgi:hypothetical protein|nr:hypothetical protein [Candidatus Angelobacter sp.]